MDTKRRTNRAGTRTCARFASTCRRIFPLEACVEADDDDDGDAVPFFLACFPFVPFVHVACLLGWVRWL